jgi:serine/threonine protein kinase
MDKKQVGWGLYIAPELSGNGPHDEKVDVYSFGCIVYALLTNDPIFSDCSDLKVWKHLVDGWRPSIPCMVPACLQNLIKRCWSEDPNSRPSFQEIVQELSDPSFKMFPGSDVNAVWRRMAFIQRKEQQCGEDLM